MEDVLKYGLLSVLGDAAGRTAHCTAQAGKHDGQGHLEIKSLEES